MTDVVAYAPGRINLIGDHTDHTGGLCFPMAIDLGVEVAGVLGRNLGGVRLTSDAEVGAADVPLDVVRADEVEPPCRRGSVVERRARGGGGVGARRTAR